jgi:hypothetical protein
MKYVVFICFLGFFCSCDSVTPTEKAVNALVKDHNQYSTNWHSVFHYENVLLYLYGKDSSFASQERLRRGKIEASIAQKEMDSLKREIIAKRSLITDSMISTLPDSYLFNLVQIDIFIEEDFRPSEYLSKEN